MLEEPTVTSLERAERPAAWAEPSVPLRFILDTAAIARSELRKVSRDPVEVFTRAVQPILWLVIFGQVMSSLRAIPTGSLSYLDYLAPGILAQSALFSSIFYGIAVIWERDLGIVHKLLVSPASRTALVSGKALAGGVRAIVQAVIVTLVAALIGIHLRVDLVSIVEVVAVVVLGSALFATFSLDIACLVKSRERFMGIGQLLTMPLFFASSAIYPVALMPDWLKVVATLNPLTYMVDALRSLMIVGGVSEHGLATDFAVLSVGLVIMLAIGTRLYPRLAQ
jgi:ABC-2 type transport system permease protein